MQLRKTRERKLVDYKEKVSMDWEDSDDEPTPSTSKKRGGKKSKVDNDEQDDAPPVKKATKKSQSKLLGALENIKLMPFDIVSEICGADKGRFLSGSLRMRLCGLCKHAHLISTSQARKLGSEEDVHPDAVYCVSYHYTSSQTLCLYLDLQRVSKILFELQDEHDAELRQRETYERLSAGTRNRRPRLVTSAPNEGISQLKMFLEEREGLFGQRQEEGVQIKAAVQRYHQQDWAAHRQAQLSSRSDHSSSINYIRSRINELGVIGSTHSYTVRCSIDSAAAKIKVTINQDNFEKHKTQLKKYIEAAHVRLTEEQRRQRLLSSFRTMYWKALEDGDIECAFPLPDEHFLILRPEVDAFVKKLPKVAVFTDEMWNANIESIAGLLDLYDQHRRVHIIKLILSATTDKPYKQLSDKLSDYPPERYGDRFFALAKHALVASLRVSNYPGAHDISLIDSLNNHLADPKVLWIREPLTVASGGYNRRDNSAVWLELPIAITVKSVIARVGWDYDTTTIEELNDLGRVFDWTYRKDSFKNGTWRDIVHSVAEKLGYLSTVDIQLFEPPQITYKTTQSSPQLALGLEVERSGEDGETAQISSDDEDEDAEGPQEESEDLDSDEE